MEKILIPLSSILPYNKEILLLAEFTPETSEVNQTSHCKLLLSKRYTI